MVRSRGGSNGGGWVVGYRSVTCSWRFSHGWSKEKRENKGGRGGTVDTICTADARWWTKLAWQTADGGQSLHGDQSLHGGPIPLVLSLSLCSSLSLLSLLALSLSLSLSFGVYESRNHLKVKQKRKWFSGLKGLFYGQSLKFYGKLYFTCAPKHIARCKIFSGNHLHPKQTQPKSISKTSYPNSSPLHPVSPTISPSKPPQSVEIAYKTRKAILRGCSPHQQSCKKRTQLPTPTSFLFFIFYFFYFYR